jgi:TPR repeat protein
MTKLFSSFLAFGMALLSTSCGNSRHGTSPKAIRVAGELRDLASKGDAAALKELTALAESDNRAAQYVLGTMYDAGNGLPEDSALAAKWYRRAADQGDAGAQFALGVMYNSGQGVDRDPATAVTWFRKSAEQGLATGQANLGGMYAMGEGVPKNPVLALMWLRLAARNPHGNAGSQISALERSMTPVQIAQAQKLSEDWQALRGQRPTRIPKAMLMPSGSGTGVLGDQLEAAGR